MDIARCTLNNRDYNIPTFEALTDQQIGSYRRYLICPDCFGARPHAINCPMAAGEPRRGGGLGPGQDERINLGERIEVDFDYGAHTNVNPDPHELINQNGRGGRYVGTGGRRTAVMHRRLSTLLRNLMHSEDFRLSEQVMALPEGEFRVRDFFIEFSEITDDHEDEYRGYWGFISDAALSRDTPPNLWLNSGGRDDVSIVVNSGLLAEFSERFFVDELENLAGSYALVFGRLRISQYGKKYLVLNDIAKISISI